MTTAGSLLTWWGNTNKLTAPSNATTLSVTLAYYGKRDVIKYTTSFTVVEPTGVASATVSYTIPYDYGIAGAGMHLRPVIGPTSVSFYRVQCLEVGLDATNVSGFFTNFPVPALSHKQHGADRWFGLGYDNSWNEPWDDAASDPYTSWYAGGFRWIIPGRWKVGSGRTNELPNSWSQTFSMDDLGTMTVSKFAHTKSRTVQGVYSGQ
jgi:hypothetical protein